MLRGEDERFARELGLQKRVRHPGPAAHDPPPRSGHPEVAGERVRSAGVWNLHSLTPSWLAAIFIAMWAPAVIVVRRFVRRHAGGDRLDGRVEVGMVKESMVWRREGALPSSRGLPTRCRVEVQRSLVQRAIMSPRFEGALRRAHRLVRHPDLEPAVRHRHREDREGAVVGVCPGAELSRGGRRRRVVVAREDAEVSPDGAGEELLRLAESDRKDAKEVGREPFVRPIDGNQCVVPSGSSG